MHTNETTYYGLPQFLATDKGTWLGDLNPAFEQIANVLHTIDAETTGNASVLEQYLPTLQGLSAQLAALDQSIKDLYTWTTNTCTWATLGELTIDSPTRYYTFNANKSIISLWQLPHYLNNSGNSVTINSGTILASLQDNFSGYGYCSIEWPLTNGSFGRASAHVHGTSLTLDSAITIASDAYFAPTNLIFITIRENQ